MGAQILEPTEGLGGWEAFLALCKGKRKPLNCFRMRTPRARPVSEFAVEVGGGVGVGGRLVHSSDLKQLLVLVWGFPLNQAQQGTAYPELPSK